eukprot:COSAG05_NODE_446_length_9772_cov_117.012923_11_plen_63_part_00
MRVILFRRPGWCVRFTIMRVRACVRARAKVKDLQDVTTHAHARVVLGHFRLWMDTVCLVLST